MSLTVSSQNATDSVVVLKKDVAVMIVEDLMRLDHLEEENVILLEQLNVETRKVTLGQQVVAQQDSIIVNLEGQLGLSSDVLAAKDDQIEHWKKEYRRQKRQKFLTGGIGLCLIVLLLL